MKVRSMVSSLLATVAALALLTGCAGDEAAPFRTVQGAAMKGPLNGATVEAFEIDATGAAVGQPLASARTDSDGGFSLALPADGRSFLVRSRGGDYRDEADQTGRRFLELRPAEGLATVLLPNEGSVVALTPYSAAVYARALRHSGTGQFDSVYRQALDQATAAWKFDPVTTLPANPTAPGAAVGAARDYALLLGGAAVALQSIAVRFGLPQPDFALIQAFIDDLGDGLDGAADGASVLYDSGGAKTLMPGDVELNQRIQRFKLNNNNTYGASSPTPQTDDSQFGPIDVANRPPVAADDSYSVVRGGTLEVTNPGVLGNDSDPDEEELTAELEGGSSNEALTLNPGGGFTFVHDGLTDEPFVFTYRAVDPAGNAATATVTINITRAPTFSAALATGGEAVDEGAGTIDFTITRSGPTSGTQSVRFATADGTAGAEDYGSVAGVFNFTENETTKTVSVSIADDDLDEPDETFSLLLSDASGGTITTPAVSVTILDNDAAPRFGISGSTADEGAGTAPVMITRTGGTAFTATVNLATENGSAIAGADFLGISGITLSFAPGPGNATQSVNISLVNDQLSEPEESFRVVLSAPVHASLGSNSRATVIIRDDDAASTNTPPVAYDETVLVTQGQSFDGVLRVEDVDKNDPLTIQVVRPPRFGALSFPGPDPRNFRDQPNAGFGGTDQFTYRANDGKADSNDATVTLNVQAAQPPPPPPPPPGGVWGPDPNETRWNESTWQAAPADK